MEHISNAEKAREIAQSVSFFWTNEDDDKKSIIDTISLRKAIFNAALQAMEWKKQQFIDKTIDFINKRFYIGINNQVTSKENYNSFTELIRDLEQSIKGE